VIDSQFSTVICAPVFSQYTGLSSQVPVGTQEGLKHESAIHCDQLISLPKARLTDFIGSLGQTDLAQVNQALRIALAVE
jgi:mRNA interferase MazF